MLPALFAVLLLSPFAASEIYVGENPQNVNAAIKDSTGKMVPVTGVADTIEVVDLNYGNESGSDSGMAVDISVSPINATSTGNMTTMPVGEYPSTISAPSAGGPSYSGSAGYASSYGNSSPSTPAYPSLPPAPMAPTAPTAMPNSGFPASAPPSNGSNVPFTPSAPFSGYGGNASPPTAFPFGVTNGAPPTKNSPVGSYDGMISGMGPTGAPVITPGTPITEPGSPFVNSMPASSVSSPNNSLKPPLKKHSMVKRSVPSYDDTNFPSFEPVVLPAQQFQPVVYPSSYYANPNANSEPDVTNFATQNYVDDVYPTSNENVYSSNPLSQFSSYSNPSGSANPDEPNTWSSGYPTASGRPVGGSYVDTEPNYVPLNPASSTESVFVPSNPIPTTPYYVSPNPVLTEPANIPPNPIPTAPYYVSSNPILTESAYIPTNSIATAPDIPTNPIQTPNGVQYENSPVYYQTTAPSNAQPLPNTQFTTAPTGINQIIENLTPSSVIPVFPLSDTDAGNLTIVHSPTGSAPHWYQNPSNSSGNPGSSAVNHSATGHGWNFFPRPAKPTNPFNPFGNPKPVHSGGNGGNGSQNNTEFPGPSSPPSHPSNPATGTGYTEPAGQPTYPTYPAVNTGYTGPSGTHTEPSGQPSYPSYPSNPATNTGYTNPSGQFSPSSNSSTRYTGPSSSSAADFPGNYTPTSGLPSASSSPVTGYSGPSGSSLNFPQTNDTGGSTPGTGSHVPPSPNKPHNPFNILNIFNPFQKPPKNILNGTKHNKPNPFNIFNIFNPFHRPAPLSEHNSNGPKENNPFGNKGSSSSNGNLSGSESNESSNHNQKPSNPFSLFNPFKKPLGNPFSLGNLFNPFKLPTPDNFGNPFSLGNLFNPFKHHGPKSHDTATGASATSDTAGAGATSDTASGSKSHKPSKNLFNIFNPFGKPANPFSLGNLFNPFKLPKPDNFGNPFDLGNLFNPFKHHGPKSHDTTTGASATSDTDSGSKSHKPPKNLFNIFNPFGKRANPFSLGNLFNPFKLPKPDNFGNPFDLGNLFNPFKHHRPKSHDTTTGAKPTSDTGSGAILNPSKPGNSLNPFKKPTSIFTNPLMPFSQPSASVPTKPDSGKGKPPGLPFANLLNPFGSGKKKHGNPFSPFGSFIELGGSLGPVEASNDTTNNATQNVAPPSTVNYLPNVTTNASGVVPTANASDDNSFFSSFLDGLESFSPVDSIKNLLFPDSSSPASQTGNAIPEEGTQNPVQPEEDINSTSLLQNFATSMAGNASVVSVPLNFSSFGGSGNGMNSFPFNALNSTFQQWRNPKFSNSTFQQWRNPKFWNSTSPFISGGNLRNFSMPFFSTNGSLPTMFVKPSMNGTNPMFSNPFTSSSASPISSLLNSLLNRNTTAFNFTNLLAPTNATSSSLNSFLNSLLNGGSKLTASGSTLNHILPSLFGSSSSDDDYQYPEEFEENSPSSEEYSEPNDLPSMAGNPSIQSIFNKLMPSGLSQFGFSLPSLLKSMNISMPTGSLFTSSGAVNPLIGSILSKVENLFTPGQNGTTPISSLISETFGPNRTLPLGTDPLLSNGFLNPFNFTAINQTSPFNMSSLANFNPLSTWYTMLSALNSTGIAGDMSGTLSVIKDLSSLLTEVQAGTISKTDVLNRAMGDMMTLFSNMNSEIQNFTKNMPAMFNFTSLPFSTWNFTSLPPHTRVPSLFPPNTLAPSHQRPSHQRPSPTPLSFGSSFMTLPVTTTGAPPKPNVDVVPNPAPLIDNIQNPPPQDEEIQSDAPAINQPQPSQPQPAPNTGTNSTDMNKDGYFDYASDAPASAANSSPPTTPASAGAPTSAAFSIGGVSSMWITAIGFLAAVLNQRMLN